MYVIPCQNVNDAWPEAINVIQRNGMLQQTRNGPALVAPFPVCTMYSRPTECVLFDPVRDNNPIFSVMESLWMLAGRDDATFLDQFVSEFSARYAEPDGHMHGAYGYRWRRHFFMMSADIASEHDQLTVVVRLLKEDPQTRQAVIQMWSAEDDLGVPRLKDRPCNLTVSLRADRGVLDMLVNCRSNDIVYGAYGANVCHFSMLQQYLAARIGIPVGVYHQVSFNWHMYTASESQVDRGSALLSAQEPYPGTQPLVDDPETFDDELHAFLLGGPFADNRNLKNTFLTGTAQPLWQANEHRREKRYDKALATASTILAPDWRAAAIAWLQRRAAKHEEKQHG